MAIGTREIQVAIFSPYPHVASYKSFITYKTIFLNPLQASCASQLFPICLVIDTNGAFKTLTVTMSSARL